MTMKFVLALPLLLVASSLPAHALTKQEILEQEQQAFLNPQPPIAPSSLEAEQDHFLRAKLPVEQKPQPQYSMEARENPQPAAQPEATAQREFTPAAVAQPLPYDAAPIQRNIEPVQSVQAVPVARPLPSLTSPEGYSRINPAPSLRPAEINTASASPSVVTTTSITPPQIAFALVRH